MSGASSPSRLLGIVRGVWIVGFLIGTTTHVADLVLAGTNVYDGFPIAIRLFWVSLTVLDPLVAALLWFRLRAGVVLGVAVILADIAINWSVFSTIGGLSLFGVVAQSLFAAFVLMTARPLWGSSRVAVASPEHPA